MKYLSVCSGVEAATVAWHDLGFNPVAFSEIEKFPSEVLAHHYPNVPNLGDMTKYKEWNLNESIDLLVGGTPCQSFSVAGLRKGLEDPRGNLALTYVGILDKFRPKWCVWENVPGVLSSNGGRDFGSFLGALVELGYGFAYRVLDAQNFGVAQRRRRVFVVGCLGDWESAAKVLFESESLSGNIKKGRGKEKDIANCITKSPSSHSSYNPARSEGNAVVVQWPANTASTLNASFGEKLGLENQHIDSGAPLFVMQPIPIHAQATQYAGGGNNRNNDGKGNGLGIGKPGDPMNTLDTSSRHGVAYSFDSLTSNSMKSPNPHSGCRVVDLSKTIDTTVPCPSKNQGGIGILQAVGFDAYNNSVTGDVAKTLDTGSDYHHVPNVYSPTMAVRRLTPVECERLQGFPDNYTNIPWRKKDESPDGPRYKAMGNSMAVPVMHWIGQRIKEIQ
jgi:DNA (cytosine-5)-methyltransferase 1